MNKIVEVPCTWRLCPIDGFIVGGHTTDHIGNKADLGVQGGLVSEFFRSLLFVFTVLSLHFFIPLYQFVLLLIKLPAKMRSHCKVGQIHITVCEGYTST